ncbi:unnamed protein product [Schistosoma rodhaini]|uniref:Granulins domain-containing protein n=1 Tax=Schistosoma rodhaini TaxID=6188 RepID=A0AA85GEB4_9TREM|nr:unnamed protein product [Schistosoma rodhaini]CAH8648868.1 unnamed protein product [Schistosoma rodhaini]
MSGTVRSGMLFVIYVLFLCRTGIVYSNLCPRQCLPGSCCEVEENDFRCCPYANGVCCSDGNNCCPQGTQCDLELGRCRSSNWAVLPSKHMSEKVIGDLKTSALDVVLRRLSANYIMCPDRLSVCQDNTTCCPMSGEIWGCCQHASAICCPDGEHCCPHGSVCDMVNHSCKPAKFNEIPEMKESFPTLHLVSASAPARLNPNVKPSKASRRKNIHQPSAKYLLAYSGVVCPDPLYECPNNTTCCSSSDEKWACCPIPQAVCCSDGEHCCPDGYTCDLSVGECIKNSHSSNESKKFSSNTILSSLPIKIGSNALCPDSDVYCSDNSTCCEHDKKWGCCLFPNAVCCSDGIHCCPQNTICDVQEEMCISKSGDMITKLQLKSTPKLHSFKSNSRINICSDMKSYCINGTCCSNVNDPLSTLCCPYENAVCCSDGKHCCPKGTTCDMIKGGCIISQEDLSKSNSIPLLTKIPALHVTSKNNTQSTVFTQVCPGGKAKCPDSSTCCKLSSGKYACCPIPNAICCADDIHCCPPGTSCDHKTLSCVKANNDHSIGSPSANELLRNPKLLFTGVRDHVCPGHQSTCSDDQTCCRLPDKSWGCCPLKNGVCCGDHFHCCPAGSVCDLDTKQCILQLELNQSTTKIVYDGFTMHIANRKSSDRLYSRPVKSISTIDASVQAKWCGACGDTRACCPDAAFNSWSCCPYVGGECCIGQNICCPPGSRCLNNGKCEKISKNIMKSFAPTLIPSISRNNNLQRSYFIQQNNVKENFHIEMSNIAKPAQRNLLLLVRQYRRLKRQLHTICPDSLHYCGKSEQCCLSNKFGYTCTPNKSICCGSNMDTYCPIYKDCSLDGKFCIDKY